jgi:hypothetical protein
MYNLHYVPTTLGYKVEEKLYLGVREQKRLNTTGLDHVIRKVKGNKEGLKQNETLQLVFCANVNVLGEIINIIKKNT